MNFVVILIGLVHFAKAQPSIVLQYIGSEITMEQQSKLDFCESKYCLADSNYLFMAATQNKSVRPCDDFREFALGTFIKYKSISDRTDKTGFIFDNNNLQNLRLKRLLSERVTSNDTRVTSAMKKLYAKCVSSDYVRRNGVNEMREYLRTLGLKFYPETNQEDFDLSRYFEISPYHATYNLFQSKLERTNDQLRLKQIRFGSLDAYFSSYETLLYDIFQVYLNGSYSKKFKEDFHEIANRQSKFFERQQSFLADDDDSTKAQVFMTIEELNNLTAMLKLDWSEIINNQLLTKLRADEKILIDSPQAIRDLTEFLVSSDKKAIADFLVYDFLFVYSQYIVVYSDDDWIKWGLGASRSRERWDLCVQVFITLMNPALMFLYSTRYSDKKQEESIEKFIGELKEFAMRKIKKDYAWDKKVKDDIIERVNSIKVTAGYPKKILSPEKIEELYSRLLLSDRNLLNMTFEITLNRKKLELEPEDSEVRQLDKMVLMEFHEFRYSPYNDAMFIFFEYLSYPFYHHERPRFFNAATVGNFFFSALKFDLTGYLSVVAGFPLEVHNGIFYVFDDEHQAAYEFYDEWLQSGGKELSIGAHRLTNQQLFWVAAARSYYVKRREGKQSRTENTSKNLKLHEFFFKKRGFREAFNCEI